MIAVAVALIGLSALAFVPGVADAVHFYRSSDSGCSPASGAISDDGSSPSEADAVVQVLHNSYHTNETNAPVTQIEVGQTVTWVWNSEHCHSVTGTGWDSGFHYPEQEPSTPEVAPGVFGYPVPEFEDPTLTYSHTFEEPGVYPYACVHHGAIGMQGIVVVSQA